MDEPGVWAAIWLVVAAGLGIGEMVAAGTFFLLPFAAGALVASLASFFGAPVAIGWLLFVVVSFVGAPVGLGWLIFVLGSAVTFAAMRPLAARLDASSKNPLGVGATRLVGEHGVVLTEVPAGPDELGSVRIGREEWRAEALDGGPLEPGTHVTVLEVRGTRVIVYPTGLPTSIRPPERPH